LLLSRCRRSSLLCSAGMLGLFLT